MADLPFFTIGHSTRTIEDFAAILEKARVEIVVDVRTVPRSRTNPQYNRDTLPDMLAPYQIGYEPIGELGGLRSKARAVPDEINGFWQNRSFHNYADYALSESFVHGLERLLALGAKRRCALMCAEAVWWRCHRRIIADHLISRGREVFHLMDGAHEQPAKLTPGAVARADGSVVYPAAAQSNA